MSGQRHRTFRGAWEGSFEERFDERREHSDRRHTVRCVLINGPVHMIDPFVHKPLVRAARRPSGRRVALLDLVRKVFVNLSVPVQQGANGVQLCIIVRRAQDERRQEPVIELSKIENQNDPFRSPLRSSYDATILLVTQLCCSPQPIKRASPTPETHARLRPQPADAPGRTVPAADKP